MVRLSSGTNLASSKRVTLLTQGHTEHGYKPYYRSKRIVRMTKEQVEDGRYQDEGIHGLLGCLNQ